MTNTDTATQTRLWVDVIYAAYYVVLICVLFSEHNWAGGSLGMRWWDAVTRACRTAALTLGTAGIRAEVRYWQAVERTQA